MPLVPAPVPRCSPLIFINKLAEWSNLKSDSNPYFPVPPCEYGGPIQALKAKDFEAVSVLARPERIPLHNIYEFVWLLKTGFPRLLRVLTGRQEFVYDKRILLEGYQHYTKYPRTKKIGFKKYRDPSFIDNFRKWKRTLKHMKQGLKTHGPDKFDPHEDLRDSGYYTKPTHHYGVAHKSQKRKEVSPYSTPFTSSIAQDTSHKSKQEDNFIPHHQHPNHNYNDIFKSSIQEAFHPNDIFSSFTPLNSGSPARSSSLKRKTTHFRFPDSSDPQEFQYPAPSPFNYADAVTNKRQGLFKEDVRKENNRARPLRRSSPRKSINQQIDQTPKFPSFYDQADVDQNNRFNPFGTHEHPSFPQTAGGKLPSIDELKEDVNPHKLFTSDPIGTGNYDSGYGHVIDGSRKRKLTRNFQPNLSSLRSKKSYLFNANTNPGRQRKQNRATSKPQTVFQYMFSKLG